MESTAAPKSVERSADVASPPVAFAEAVSTLELASVPSRCRSSLKAELRSGENILAIFEPDLEEQLRYGKGVIVLTNDRLLCWIALSRWQSWTLGQTVTLRAQVSGAIGQIELLAVDGRLAHWRYTAGLAPAARALVQQWDIHHKGSPVPTISVCPSCGGPMAMTADLCPACQPIKERAPLSTLLRLVAFARPRAGMIAFGFVLTLVSTVASMIPPYLTMPLMDKVLFPKDPTATRVEFKLVYFYLAGLFGAALVAWILDCIRSYVSSWVSERISSDLRQYTYAHLQQLSLEFFGGKRTGDLMSRISNDTDRLCNFLSSQLVDFITDVLMIVLTAGLLLTINPWLALATLIPFPLIVWLVHWARRRLLRGYRQGSIAWAEMTSVLADTIPGIRVVKAFAQESREVDRFHVSNESVLSANDRVNLTWSFFGPIITFLTTMGLLIVWAFASWEAYNNQITVGMLTLFLAYIARFYARSESMIRFFSVQQRAAAGAQRIFEILDRVPSVAEPEKPVQPQHLQGHIELRGVRFKYGSREVLHGLDLTIEPGEMIGLVGPSGAGKTTLINLICRFFDVAEGAIFVDGVNIRSYPVEKYRQNIGIVLQEPFLFYGSIAENIAYGKPGATRAEVIAAARAARAHEFILRLADGYDSLVGERGQSLSGGERQRISIARALLIDPRILILDEATSSVDTQTEQEIQAALENLTKGRTTIAIAHRLSTLRRAHRIVVLDRGNIVEVGSHAELLENNGKYATLHNAQVRSNEEVGV